MMKTKVVVGWILGSVVLASFFLWNNFLPKEREVQENVPAASVETVMVTPPRNTVKEPLRPEPPLPTSFLISDVPFTVQAPSGQWGDPIFQDACEEASIIMAETWIRNGVLAKLEVTEEIGQLVVWQKKIFGHSIDTSITDTERMLREYYGVADASVQTDVTLDDIKRALFSDRIVIVPTDGRKLKNPNFTQPGPPRHMLVIIGYDTLAGEFIANDPGTRRGEGYRYPEATLYDAILDYPTGRHAEATSTDKVMLTVGRD